MPSPGVSNPLPADDAARLLRLRWPLIIGVWAVPALLAAFETYMFWRMSGRGYPFWRAVAMQAPAWSTYALLTPVIVMLGRRLPLQRPRLGRHVAAHLICALTAGVLYACVAALASKTFTPVPRTTPFAQLALSWYLSALPVTTLAYFAILGVGAALTHLAEARRRELDAVRLAAQLADARLGALQMQLHPHFLFNTLNAITVLARDRDTDAVTRMLILLSDLLRDVLRTDRGHQVPLEEELTFARRYLEIELVRFADRLRVSESIDEATRDLLVPAFILQPLIENALRHGLAPRADGGRVEIGARLAGEDELELWVQDDGRGLPAGWSGAGDYGMGLSNTAARLAALPGPAGTLAIARVHAGGTRATVRMHGRRSSVVEVTESPRRQGAAAAR